MEKNVNEYIKNNLYKYLKIYKNIELKDYNFTDYENKYLLFKSLLWFLDNEIDIQFLAEVVKNCSWLMSKKYYENNIEKFYDDILDYIKSSILSNPKYIYTRNDNFFKTIIINDFFNSIFILYNENNFYLKEKELILKVNSLLCILFYFYI